MLRFYRGAVNYQGPVYLLSGAIITLNLFMMKYQLSPHVSLRNGKNNCSIVNFKSNFFQLINQEAFNFLKQFENPKEIYNDDKAIEFLETCKNKGILIPENEKVTFTQSSKTVLKKRYNITIEVTNKCNYNCKHCYIADCDRKELKRDLCNSIIKKAILDFASGNKIESVVISGGEPFLYKNIFDLLSNIMEIGVSNTTIITNGSLVDRGAINRLKEFNPTIQISLLGDEKLHDFITGVDGAFIKLIKLYNELRSKNLNVFVSYLLSNPAIDIYPKLRKYLDHIDMKPRIADILPIGRAKSYQSLFEIEKEKRQNFYSENSSINDIHKVINGIIENFKQNEKPELPCASKNIGINFNGDVLPCIMMRRVTFGNIKIKSISKIIRNKNTRNFKKTIEINNIKVCKNCELVYVCNKLCPLASYAYMDQVGIKNPLCSYY